MILLMKPDCAVCAEIADKLREKHKEVTESNGDEFLTGHVNGTLKNYSKDVISEVLATLAMQDDQYPILLYGGSVFGIREILVNFGISLEEAKIS